MADVMKGPFSAPSVTKGAFLQCIATALVGRPLT
jgi:hypothetical protein